MMNAKRLRDGKTKKANWVTDDLHRQLLEHWSDPHFQEKSAKASASRMTEELPGDGPHRHISGSKSYSKRRKEYVSIITFLSFSIIFSYNY